MAPPIDPSSGPHRSNPQEHTGFENDFQKWHQRAPEILLSDLSQPSCVKQQHSRPTAASSLQVTWDPASTNRNWHRGRRKKSEAARYHTTSHNPSWKSRTEDPGGSAGESGVIFKSGSRP